MIPTEAPPVAQFAAFFVKTERNGKEQLRFLPICGHCQKVIRDISEANLAVLDLGAVGKLKRIGTKGEFKILRDGGPAALLCWDCDRKRGNNIPWQHHPSTQQRADDTRDLHQGFDGDAVAAMKQLEVAIQSRRPN
jgi:hypothetical protein